MTGKEDMDRERFEELKEAYVLGALSDEECAQFEAYLRDTPESQAEVDELTSLAGLLALSTTEMEPSPQLRRNLMSVVESEARNASPAHRRETSPPLLDRLAGFFNPQRLALGGAALAVIALLSWNLLLQGQLGDMKNEVAQSQNPQAQTSSNETINLKGSAATKDAQVELVRLDRDKAILVARNLPPLDKDKTYQLWVIHGDKPKPSSLFKTGGDLISTPVKDSLKGADTVAITVEPAGGSEAPTTTPMMSAKL